jgi:uncharacterized protein
MPLSRYYKSFPDPDRPGYLLLYSTRKGSLVRVTERLFASASDCTLTGPERDLLTRMELWTDDPAAEREAMRNLVDLTNSRTEVFEATVVLTLDCNLGCPYCFEDHFRGRHTMNEGTARLLTDHVRREQIERGRDVEMRFYGGEPLMALPRLKEIARQTQDAAISAGRKFTCSLVTNATLLTRPVVEELLSLGLTSALVTLDGPQEIHDQQRPFISGQGSFKTIMGNLQSVYDLITLKAGGNFTRQNYREFPAMLDALLEKGIDPAKLGPVQFSPIHPKSGASSHHNSACAFGSEPWLVEAHLFLRDEILRRGFAVEKPNMGVCMIELANNLVVNYDGSLYKCPAFLGWPELCVGSLAEGIGDYRASHNLDIWKTDECLDCAYLPLCFGGCRFFRKLQTGAIDGVDCRRAMLDASLERIIRQDLGLVSYICNSSHGKVDFM